MGMNKPLNPPGEANPSASQLEPGELCADAGNLEVHWNIAVETPVAVRINDEDHAVMLCTPQDLEDFARGFVLSEGILPSAKAIESLEIKQLTQGIQIKVRAPANALARQALRQRRHAARSGCGLCGIQTLEQAVRSVPRLPAAPPISAKIMQRAFSGLPDCQPIKDENHSVHGAAWCDTSGKIQLVREDVGRHNALDKLIGALAVQAIEPSNGFVILTSRCSYELVQKAATFGIRALATLSAPTSLALQLARESGLQLSAGCGGQVVTFNPEPRKP